eukprot:3245064-Pleurochrysis_carterae.AAC.1
MNLGIYHFNLIQVAMEYRVGRGPAEVEHFACDDCDSQNFRHSASVPYCPIRHWESGDRMTPLTQHSPSTY